MTINQHSESVVSHMHHHKCSAYEIKGTTCTKGHSELHMLIDTFSHLITCDHTSKNMDLIF
jgi:hypothetical protein